MSTTFGVKTSNEIVEVVYRDNGGKIIWLSKLAELLPDNTRLIPIDNTAQGIYTIGDVKRLLESSPPDITENVRCPNLCFDGYIKELSSNRAFFDICECHFCDGSGIVSKDRANEIEKEL